MRKIALIKFGGHSFKEKNGLNTLIYNIKFLKKMNYKIIICHGGTPSVEEKLKKENIKSEFLNGYRVTTKEIMNIVEESILGNEALKIIKSLNIHNLSSININGNDSFSIRCKPKEGYGFVGEIYDVNTELLDILINNNYIPVISPIGCDDKGNSYNLNSDYLASEIAKKMNVDLFLMITNVNGVYEDINNPNSRIPIINEIIVKQLYEKNKIGHQMKTKIDAMLDFVSYSHTNAYILCTTQKLNYDFFYKNNFGTKVLYNEIRLAFKEDIKNIINMTKKSFVKYQERIKYKIDPLLENKDDIYKDILNKYVFVYYHEDTLVATARVTIKDNTAKLSRICVNPDYQNKGIGSFFLNYIEDYISKKGVSFIGLTTMNNTPYLEKFYKKNNYELLLTNSSRDYERAILIKKIDINKLNINSYFFIKE